ncbi:hypothetical protein LTR12_012864 [Friedmanniomyces endolithicus]|nr:hypothetical protein LTR74_013920 [Friedmanniomyces endolithicus]KAK1812770.1 hypothetical protein LTR12_012864 [Friedmanniomyces endolithicus]
MSSDNATLSAQVKKLNITEETNSDTAPSDLAAVVDDLLNQLSSKFSNLSGELIGKSVPRPYHLDVRHLLIKSSGRDVSTA